MMHSVSGTTPVPSTAMECRISANRSADGCPGVAQSISRATIRPIASWIRPTSSSESVPDSVSAGFAAALLSRVLLTTVLRSDPEVTILGDSDYIISGRAYLSLTRSFSSRWSSSAD